MTSSDSQGDGRRRIIPPTAKVGLAPGTVVYTGRAPTGRVLIDMIDYDQEHFQERRGVDVDDALAGPGDGRVRWVSVSGVHDAATLDRIGSALRLHPLTLEDLASVTQRPKVERFPDHLYLVTRTLTVEAQGQPVIEEQLSLVLTEDLVVTFEERPGELLEPLRHRLRAGLGRSRGLGADYLAYAIVDLVVDHYFRVLERLSDRLDEVETRVTGAVNPAALEEARAVRHELFRIRHVIWPTRELLGQLQRGDDTLITDGVRTFLSDAHDHAVMVLETVELLRETAIGIQESYLANLSHRTNDIMRLLTIIATVFIPLTFVVGVYGMNFTHMPELGWRWGYPAVWLVMVAMSVVMVVIFRRRGWF